MKSVFYTLLWILPFGTVSLADTTQQALDVLNKMNHALQSLNYQGTMVYLHDGKVESMQLFHKKDDIGEYERLVHLSGEAREVIRKNDQVTCFMPDNQSVIVGQRNLNNPLLVKLNSSYDAFTDRYTFSMDGKTRVAGHNALIVRINPKDQYRYGYRLSVGTDNYLLLKSELISRDGTVLEQLMFAQIDVVPNISESVLKPSVSGESFTWHRAGGSDKPSGKNVDSGWRITQLPAGFTLTGHFKQLMPNSEQVAEHMVVSDGLASISVYIEQFSAESQSFVGASKLGAVNVYGSVLEDHQVTVVGEVPHPTVKMIAESVAYRPSVQPALKPQKAIAND